jgi:hypothetical protein
MSLHCVGSDILSEGIHFLIPNSRLERGRDIVETFG